MKTIRAFQRGMREFRVSFTTHYADPNLTRAYDMGRDLAHRLTLRYFED